MNLGSCSITLSLIPNHPMLNLSISTETLHKTNNQLVFIQVKQSSCQPSQVFLNFNGWDKCQIGVSVDCTVGELCVCVTAGSINSSNATRVFGPGQTPSVQEAILEATVC